MEAQIYSEILRCIESGEEAALLTVIAANGSTPRKEGAKMLLWADGKTVGTIGGGKVESLALEEAKEVLRSGKSRILKYDLKETGIGSMCGGEMEIFVEPVQKAPPIYIFGAGHVGLPLSKIAKILGMRVNIVDDRPEFATRERFPDADRMWVGNWEKTLNELPLDERSIVVIATYSHEVDMEILRSCVMKNVAYLGMIGSKRKVEKIFEALQKEGIPEERLKIVHAPIGVSIDAETPAEIAISILAEIISVLKGKH